MNKSQMINTLTEKTDCPIKTADKVVRIFFDSIKEALSEGDKVEIRGFGSFTVKYYEAYLGRNHGRENLSVFPRRSFQSFERARICAIEWIKAASRE